MGTRSNTHGSSQGMPPGLIPMFDSIRAISDQPGVGVDNPEAVVRMVVLDAIKQFVRLTGRHPRLLYIPRSVEAALQVDQGRNLGRPSKRHGKLRDQSLLFTCTPVWDSDEFRVE